MYRVLLVDDEPNILSALRRSLAAVAASELDGDRLSIETFTSPQAALERCEEQDFDLIISDFRMPAMDGVELLSRLIEVQPHVPRMIISGYADRDAIITAINDTQISRFLGKPWDDEQLRSSVIGLLRDGRLDGSKPTAAKSAGGAAKVDSAARRLERECPGITQIERCDDGGIFINLDDD
jgi:DNA-binding NtrC family response regulator